MGQSPNNEKTKIKDPETQRLVKTARKQGWKVAARSNTNHVVFYPPDPRLPPIFHPGTSSDVRAIKNLRSRLRREGLVL